MLFALCPIGCSPPPGREEATVAIKNIIDAEGIPCDFEINGVGFGEGDSSNGYFLADIRDLGGEKKFTRIEVLFQKVHNGDEWIITDISKIQLIGTAKRVCDASSDK